MCECQYSCSYRVSDGQIASGEGGSVWIDDSDLGIRFTSVLLPNVLFTCKQERTKSLSQERVKILFFKLKLNHHGVRSHIVARLPMLRGNQSDQNSRE